MRARAALVWPLAMVLLACAPRVSLRVPGKAIAELPLERKLTLLDAENGLLAAVDARDAQEDRALAAGEARKAAAQRLRETEDAEGKEGGSAEARRAARTEAEARRTFAERDRELQRALLKVSDAELLVADALFEESRAAEVEAAALPGAGGIHAADFAAQVASLQHARDEALAEARPLQAALDKARSDWDAARGALAALTGGAQGSVWVN